MDRDSLDIPSTARLFKALSHPARLELACHLIDTKGRATQKRLVQELGWPQSTTCRHLMPLRESGLVRGRRSGSEVVLEVEPVVLMLLQCLLEWMKP